MKKVTLLLAGLLWIAGCTTMPDNITEQYNEDGVAHPEWATKVGALKARRAEKEKQIEAEYNKLISEQPAQNTTK